MKKRTFEELAQIVKEEIEKAYTDKQIIINSLNIQDVRNYKVSLEKAKNNLRFTVGETISCSLK